MPRKPQKPKVRRTESGVPKAALSYFWWDGTLRTQWSEGKTEEQILQFWQTHREQLLDAYIERNRERGGEPGLRPHWYWDELERQGHKRRRTGTCSWVGPVRPDGGDRTVREARYETDIQFLKRLGLPLADWEQKK